MDYTDLNEAQQACKNEIERCFALAEKHFGRTFTRPKVEFSNRMRTCAGKLSFNRETAQPTLLQLSNSTLQLNGSTFVKRTPGHEVAHAVAIEQYGDFGHGRGWKAVMRLFGIPAERTHNMQAIRNKTTRYQYKATCGTIVTLSAVRHNRVLRGCTYVVSRTRGKITKEGLIHD